VKSDASDELINTYLLRPLAGQLVRALYHTRVTPNGITIAAILTGVLSATLYSFNTPVSSALGGLSLTLKDFLDSADGQLARAKNMYSRTGRFLDSLGDIIVNALVFGVITTVLTTTTGNSWMPLFGFLAFLGTTLRVSYHVFYQTSYLHLHDTYQLNRITEELTAEDEAEDRLTRHLQKVFLKVYGWQDRMMVRLDSWCRGVLTSEPRAWYCDHTGLRLSGFLGLGTELSILMIFSLFNALEEYVYVNVVVLNLLWLGSIVYRKMILSQRLLSSLH
jgi:phosphatidylglycerophosphate synthase